MYKSYYGHYGILIPELFWQLFLFGGRFCCRYAVVHTDSGALSVMGSQWELRDDETSNDIFSHRSHYSALSYDQQSDHAPGSSGFADHLEPANPFSTNRTMSHEPANNHNPATPPNPAQPPPSTSTQPSSPPKPSIRFVSLISVHRLKKCTAICGESDEAPPESSKPANPPEKSSWPWLGHGSYNHSIDG